MFRATAEIEAPCAGPATERMRMLDRVALMRILEASDAVVGAEHVNGKKYWTSPSTSGSARDVQRFLAE